MPDLVMGLSGITMEGPGHCQVDYTVSGTNIDRVSGHPLFPLGKSVMWNVRASLSLDPAGKVRTVDLMFAFFANPRIQPSILEALTRNAMFLAFTSSGCRLLQDAVEASSLTDHCSLVEQLRGHVWEATRSPHAHHVLQKYIVSVPPYKVHFLVEELQRRAVQAAQNRFGCRVLERLIEHCPPQQIAPLVEEVLSSALLLSRHAFGNFVVQSILEHGIPPWKSRLVKSLHAKLRSLARHKIASNVVRCAMTHCSPEDRTQIVEVLREVTPQDATNLSRHCIGSFVFREARFISKTPLPGS